MKGYNDDKWVGVEFLIVVLVGIISYVELIK